MSLFYGKSVPMDTAAPSYLNSTRYQNVQFDSLFSQALLTDDRDARMQLLAGAEAQLMQDAVVAPLYRRAVRAPVAAVGSGYADQWYGVP